MLITNLLLQNNKCFSATDILEGQGLSTKKCFARSSVGQLCSAIVDRPTQGESICEDEMFDDLSCVNDAVEQLFDLLAVDNDMLTLTELHTLISNQLHGDHHRSVREKDGDDHDDEHNHDDEDDHDHDDEDDHDHDDEDDHDHDKAANQNVLANIKLLVTCICVMTAAHTHTHICMHKYYLIYCNT